MSDVTDELSRLRDALGAAGHGWKVAQAATDRAVAEHRSEVDRLRHELAQAGVAREQLRQRMAAENEKLRASRDDWKAIARECEAGTFTVTDGTLDDWLVSMRRGNDIVFSHARAAGLADAIERLRASASPDAALCPACGAGSEVWVDASLHQADASGSYGCRPGIDPAQP